MILTLTIVVIGMFIIHYSEKIIYYLDCIIIDSKDFYESILAYIIFIAFTIYTYLNFKLSYVIIYILIYLILYVVAIIDRNTGIIPDKYNLFILALGFINMLVGNTSIKEALFSTLPILLLFITVIIMETILKAEVMGGGDLKLLFVLSLVLGFNNILGLLFVSNLLFLLRKKGEAIVPFAPYIYKGYLILFPFVKVYGYCLFN